jgi:DNA sulfur modification protein DndB
VTKNYKVGKILAKELFDVKHMHTEVKEFARNSKDTPISNKLIVENFATVKAVYGKQFGREIYSTVLRFADLIKFLEVFPDVQRGLLRRRVISIKNYVLSGVYAQSNLRFFSSLTATAEGNLFYNAGTSQLAIDTRNSKLSVNDGQHRLFGISEAIQELRKRHDQEKGMAEKAFLKMKLEELEDMVIPVLIFDGISEVEEKQLFHDLNNLAQRPSRSATINLAQTDLFARMARELAEENVHFSAMGVEMDKTNIHKGNKNRVLLTTIYHVVKELIWKQYIKSHHKPITEENFDEYKAFYNDTINMIMEALPSDTITADRGTYLFDKSFTLRGIAKFVHTARTEYSMSDLEITNAIQSVNWKVDLDYWNKYGAIRGLKGGVSFGSSGDYGKVAIVEALTEQLTEDQEARRYKTEQLGLEV